MTALRASALRQLSRLRFTSSPLPINGSLRTPHTYFLARLLSDSLRNQLDDIVKKHDLVVFMKGTPDTPLCGFSRAVCQILEVQGVDFDKVRAINVLEDEELRQGIKEFSSWPTIPQVYLKGEFVGGCDIMLNMHQSGELETMLEKAGLLLPEEVEEKKQ
ncbi:uncharacterized protein VTP21DRAFT_826 [Calcarisporiella thermophila]|uniref:uncharacterized protein n=1 Tax=Calcarisporiella thermophila TaxID=911321 RepID=UPI003742B66B